ncbi:uncharacterized protein V6R79_015937 [Siganus canaliculatus]
METRVLQVGDLMSSKRFRLVKKVGHFNDGTKIADTIDWFLKVQPPFHFLSDAFRQKPQTPKQSVDEVMVAYKGRTAET